MATVNPARAGMIPVTLKLFTILAGKPRACGDDPDARMGSVTVTG